MKKFWTRGEFLILFTGSILALSMVLLCGLIIVLFANGFGHFVPSDIALFKLNDGKVVMGELTDREKVFNSTGGETKENLYRIQIKRANRDVYGQDFTWVDESQVKEKSFPDDVTVFERTEWGNFFGWAKEVWDGDKLLSKEPKKVLNLLEAKLPEVKSVVDQIHHIEKNEIGRVNYYLEKSRLQLKKLSLEGINSGEEVDELNQEIKDWSTRYQAYEKELMELRTSLTERAVVETVEGQKISLPLSSILKIYQPNTFGILSKISFGFEKAWDFISMDPRESNTEGGVFPALFGTVLMVLIMSIVVTPFGVLAAIFLREYAKQGTVISMVRIAVNNLAGVPSIVFGVFGVGFFIYFVGGTIDRVFFPEALPTPTYGTGGILWASLTLALLTVPVVIVTTEEGLSAVSQGIREASLAVGSTKFETLKNVVLPAVMPSILTGLILAMARAAGEVAPLMITGVVKMAPSLPLDSFFPFIHLDRKFMHLGFHIFDVGFQSPNIDAAKPMVYTTTLLLLGLILILNSLAIALRTRLRKKLRVSNI